MSMLTVNSKAKAHPFDVYMYITLVIMLLKLHVKVTNCVYG